MLQYVCTAAAFGYLMECPSDLRYDANSHVCNYKENVSLLFLYSPPLRSDSPAKSCTHTKSPLACKPVLPIQERPADRVMDMQDILRCKTASSTVHIHMQKSAPWITSNDDTLMASKYKGNASWINFLQVPCRRCIGSGGDHSRNYDVHLQTWYNIGSPKGIAFIASAAVSVCFREKGSKLRWSLSYFYYFFRR